MALLAVLASASFVSLAVDWVDTVDGVNGVDGVNSRQPRLGKRHSARRHQPLISTPLRIISLTARSKASDVQAIAGHTKTQWKRFLVSRDSYTALTLSNRDW